MFRIEGDSMEDTLRSGDLVMINQGDTHVRPDNVYLLHTDDFLMIKRLEPQLGGILLVRSDNRHIRLLTLTLLMPLLNHFRFMAAWSGVVGSIRLF